MKKTFTLLSLIITLAIHAQNWSPIMTNQKMNYKHSDSAIITNTIWVDSTLWIYNDTTYYFNKVMKDVPDNPDLVLRNQSQFFTEYIKKHANGIFVFATPENYLIATLANLGYSWVFANGLNAEVSNVAEEVIFGIQDSTKTIGLSDGNEIQLSKNFGIIKFPDFENGGYFELVGIQDTEFGEQVIDFWDIFDFEVGDVFQRYYRESFPSFYDQHISKFLINSKEVFSDHITYNVYNLTAGYYSYWGGENNYYSNVYSGDNTYLVADYPMTNKFQNELLQLNGYYCSPNYNDDYIFTRISTYHDSLGLRNKHWGTYNNLSFYVGLYYETDPSNDILTIIPYECLAEGPHAMTYTESLGITLNYYNDNYESQDYYYLMGYEKDGVTVGTVYPDSYFITGIESQSLGFNNYIVYPNPAKDWIYIKPINSNNSGTYNFELRNIIGQIIRKESIIESSLYAIDISDFKAGVYFYQIEDKSGNIQQEKIIIK